MLQALLALRLSLEECSYPMLGVFGMSLTTLGMADGEKQRFFPVGLVLSRPRLHGSSSASAVGRRHPFSRRLLLRQNYPGCN